MVDNSRWWQICFGSLLVHVGERIGLVLTVSNPSCRSGLTSSLTSSLSGNEIGSLLRSLSFDPYSQDCWSRRWTLFGVVYRQKTFVSSGRRRWPLVRSVEPSLRVILRLVGNLHTCRGEFRSLSGLHENDGRQEGGPTLEGEGHPRLIRTAPHPWPQTPSSVICGLVMTNTSKREESPQVEWHSLLISCSRFPYVLFLNG